MPRPPVTGQTRDEILRVRVTKAERALLQAEADTRSKPLGLHIHDELFPKRKPRLRRTG